MTLITRRWLKRRPSRRVPDAASDPVRYRDWIKKFDRLFAEDREAIRHDIGDMDAPPLVTLLLLVRDNRIDLLQDTVQSIRDQLYERWQLLVLDVTGEASLPETLGDDPRLDFGRDDDSIGSRSANTFLGKARGDYLVVVECGDRLSVSALYCVVREGLDHPRAELIYSDEDRLDEAGARVEPHLKPSWSPDLFFSYNYLGGLVALKMGSILKVGGFRSGSKQCLIYDLLLRYVADLSRDQVRHIPEILYHRRSAGPFEKDEKRAKSIRESVRETLSGPGQAPQVVPGRVEGTSRIKWPLPRQKPWVSVIVPTRNQHQLLRNCLDTLRLKTEYEGFETVVVDNQSDDPKSIAYLDSIRDIPGVRVLSLDAPFNYSALNNLAVRESQGEILAFLNNDVEIVSPDWLEEMVSHAIRPNVGAVGAKLCYPDRLVQHGGVLLGGGAKRDPVAAHLGWGLRQDELGYFGESQIVRNLSAVTAACMVIQRELFDGVGGFDDVNLEVAFNDVDLCLRLGELRYWIVWTPYAELMHHESKSRGNDLAPKNRKRFRAEVQYMRDRWGDRLDHDPFYNVNLDPLRADTTLAFPPRRIRPWVREP